MANKALKSIKFPGLPNTYTVPQVDATLETSGAAADAKKVGDELTDVKADLSLLEKNVLTTTIKQSLLSIMRQVAYIVDNGQDYYEALQEALYPPEGLVQITAVFNRGVTPIHEDTSLDTLKTMLTVTAEYDDGTTETLADIDYTLSGTLTVGTSTITVTYKTETTTFSVPVYPDNVIYTLKNQPILRADGYDTGINLIDSNKAFTILFDAQVTEWVRATCLLWEIDTSDYRGLNVGRATGTNHASIRWFQNYQNATTNQTSTPFRLRFAAWHEAGGNTLYCSFKYDDGTVETISVSGTWSSRDVTVHLGAAVSADNRWSGTMTDLEIYDKVLDAADINEWLGVSE